MFEEDTISEIETNQKLLKEIEEIQFEIKKKINEYQKIVNEYNLALNIINPKMDNWKKSRKKILKQNIKKIITKWNDIPTILMKDAKLNFDVKIFNSLLNVKFKQNYLVDIYHQFQKKKIEELYNNLLLF